LLLGNTNDELYLAFEILPLHLQSNNPGLVPIRRLCAWVVLLFAFHEIPNPQKQDSCFLEVLLFVYLTNVRQVVRQNEGLQILLGVGPNFPPVAELNESQVTHQSRVLLRVGQAKKLR
jgi:hypothetical protein